jgi:hypothetical protein
MRSRRPCVMRLNGQVTLLLYLDLRSGVGEADLCRAAQSPSGTPLLFQLYAQTFRAFPRSQSACCGKGWAEETLSPTCRLVPACGADQEIPA